MARGDIRQRIAMEGAEEVLRQLRALGSAGEKAFDELRAASGAASTNLAGVSNIARDLQLVFGRMGGLGAIGAGAFSSIGTAAAGMTTALGATIAVAAAAAVGLGALAVSGAKAASDIKEGAIRVGVAADDYTKMNFVFSQSGSSAEGFEKAMAIILAASAKAADAAEKAATDIAAADDKLKQSAKDVTAEVQKTYRDRAEAGRVMAKGLADSLADIARDEVKALRDLTESRDPSKQLSDEEKIRRQFSERRIDAERAHEEKLAEQKKKDAAADLELTIKHNKDRADALKAYNKTVEDAAATLQDPISKITRLTKGDGSARDPVEVFKDIAQAVSEIADPAGRAGKAIEIFGRRVGGQLTESLAEGRAGIEKLAKESDALGLNFLPEQLKVGKAFSDTLSKLGDVAHATTAKVGLEFSGLFGDLGELLAAQMGRAQKPIVEFANSIAHFIKPAFVDLALVITGNADKIESQFIQVLIPVVKGFGQVVANVWTLISAAFKLGVKAFEDTAKVLNDVFGTKLTTGDIPAFIAAIYLGAKAIAALTAGFGLLNIAAAPWLLLVGGIALAIGALFLPIDTLKTGLAVVFGPETTASIVSFVAFFRVGAKDLYDTFVGTIQGIKDIFNNGMLALQDGWTIFKQAFQTSIIDPMVKGIETVIFWVNWLIGLAKKALDAVGLLPGSGSTPTGSSESIGSNAGGGLIRGPGTGTSDSILSWVSNGEYVIRNAAVKHFGVGLFEALNRLRSPRFALGGLMEGMDRSLMPRTPRFAGGGLVTAGGGGMGAPVHLHFPDGSSFGPMIADEKIAEAVIRYGRGKGMLSAMRKPGSYA